jgi:hypothetical protein
MSAPRRRGPSASPEAQRQYRAANREMARAHSRKAHLKRAFDIAPEDVDAMLAYQGSKCATCDKDLSSPYIDHDHTQGHVRGLLCCPCNNALDIFEGRRKGVSRQSPERQARFRHYLDNPPSFGSIGARIVTGVR